MKIYNKYSDYLKNRYGEKVYKLPIKIDGTCPNRDGVISYGGCAFCGEEGGSFENLPSTLSVKEQVKTNKEYISKRYKAKKFISYFQNYTNTYLDIEKFKAMIKDSIIDETVGIYISTRPDCINFEQLEFLEKLRMDKNIDIVFELGLQTANYQVLEDINRGHGLADFIKAIMDLKSYGFETCIHVIIGLQGTNITDTIETAKILSVLGVEQVKIHALYILKNTKYGKMYQEGDFEPISLEDYINQVVVFLRYLSDKIVIQRLIGRSSEENSFFSNWGMSWWKIQDLILDRMEKNGYTQGDLNSYLV